MTEILQHTSVRFQTPKHICNAIHQSFFFFFDVIVNGGTNTVTSLNSFISYLECLSVLWNSEMLHFWVVKLFLFCFLYSQQQFLKSVTGNKREKAVLSTSNCESQWRTEKSKLVSFCAFFFDSLLKSKPYLSFLNFKRRSINTKSAKFSLLLIMFSFF